MYNFNDKIFFSDENDVESESFLSYDISKYNDKNIFNSNDNLCKDKKNIFFYIYPNSNSIKKREIKNQKKKKEIIKNNDNIKKTNNSDNKSININCNSRLIWKVNKGKQYMNLYRKDAYIKHFKAIFGQYIRNKINLLKNKCFPFFSKNNISSPNYKYIGNPKEKENFNFLSFTIKDILIYGIDKKKQNRQYNNEIIIKYIENNESKSKDKYSYVELIKFLNDKLEKALIYFYDDINEFNKIKKDKKYIDFDKHYKHETGISLLEKYGFIEVLKRYST